MNFEHIENEIEVAAEDVSLLRSEIEKTSISLEDTEAVSELAFDLFGQVKKADEIRAIVARFFQTEHEEASHAANLDGAVKDDLV